MAARTKNTDQPPPDTEPETPAAAPLSPPTEPEPAPRPSEVQAPAAQATLTVGLLGYFTEDGEPIDLKEAFGLQDDDHRSVVTARIRVYAHTRPAGLSTTLITLAVAAGQDVPRSWVDALSK